LSGYRLTVACGCGVTFERRRCCSGPTSACCCRIRRVAGGVGGAEELGGEL